MTSPPTLTSAPLSTLPGVRHGFFGRRGGVSGGIYASLNCGPGSQDTPDDVEENRRRVAEALNVAPDHLLSAYQVHSAEAVVVTGPWNVDAEIGAETGRETDERPRVDALVTQTPGVALSALAADCAPVLLADAQARVIGAAHAGWKGALTGVTDAALDAMERLGAKRERIVAAIGPCIGPSAYEVGPEYEARFLDADPANARFFAPTTPDGDHRLFDLKAYVTARLIGAGVATVDTRPDCTYTQGDTWFSHRRAVHRGEPDFGRNISVIVLDE